MKIAVIGVGAMGSVYASLFAEAGHDVIAVDSWKEHVAEINRNGLRLSGASGDRTIRGIHATTDYSETEGAGLFIIATKAGSVSEAAEAIAPFTVNSNSIVVTIQNGLGAVERISAHISADKVLLGVAEGFGASIKAPGHAHHSAMKLIRLGEISGGISERLNKITGIWTKSGFLAKAFEDIGQLIWEKFVCNVTFSAPCAVFNRTVGELMSDSYCWNIATKCAKEAFSVGLLEEIKFSFDDPVPIVTEFGLIMPDARPSLALDHIAGKLSEIDAINGMVPVLASRHGQNAPLNQALTDIIKFQESLF